MPHIYEKSGIVEYTRAKKKCSTTFFFCCSQFAHKNDDLPRTLTVLRTGSGGGGEKAN